MNALFTTILDLPFATQAFIAWLFLVPILYFSYLRKNRRDYYEGVKAGRDEERTLRNRLMIPAKMDSFKKGRIVERARSSWSCLPHNVEFNGPQNAGSATLLVFTDLLTGGTFTVEPSKSDHSGILAGLSTLRSRLEYSEAVAPNEHDHPTATP